MAINTWLQHKRRGDPLRDADEHAESDSKQRQTTDIALDLDRALSTLHEDVRMCIVLAYHERMTHAEIAAFTGLPLGTIKSHIRRGSKKLQEELAAYLVAGGTAT
jgi:RNA polymerase sigma-70 factor (ECF subfamily)